MPTAGGRRRDLLIVVVTVAVNVGGVLSEVAKSDQTPLGTPFAGLLIGVVAGVVLWWRKRAPAWVMSGIVGLCLLYHLVGYPGLAPAAALFVAAYAVTANAPSRRLLLAIGLIAIAAVIPLLPPHPADFNVGALFGPPIGMVGLAAMGEATRVQRAAMAEQVRAAHHATQQEAGRQLAEQRLEIARELHDVLAHTITIISVQAAVGAEALGKRPEQVAQSLAAVRSAAREALSELRGVLAGLRTDSDLDSANLDSANLDRVAAPQPGLADLPRLIDQTIAGGVAVRFVTTGTAPTMTATIELTIYRVVQEALTNIIRHSHADTAAVSLAYAPGHVVVDVSDDGPAVEARLNPNHVGHGLVGMQERVRLLGGRLTAGPTQQGGFQVLAELPIRSSL
ncbi:sensor histidine kinase [Kribbella sp. NPDC055071]